MDARIETTGPSGRRARGAENFYAGPAGVGLDRGEIITALHLPATNPGQGTAYEQFPSPATGAALCGVAAAVMRGQGDRDTTYRLAVVGAAGYPLRLRGVEAALNGQGPAASRFAAAMAHMDDEAIPYVSDFHASAEYRTHLTRVLAERALARAAERAR
jgi:carbon-monoxide dehydrogenase medium subunit